MSSPSPPRSVASGVTLERVTRAVSRIGPLAERVAFGTSAASGLIVVACLSALPAATCTAIAQTYYFAILVFGQTALQGLIAAIISPSLLTHDGRLSFFSICRGSFVMGVIAATVYWFVGGVAAGQENLSHATRQCFVGNSA